MTSDNAGRPEEPDLHSLDCMAVINNNSLGTAGLVSTAAIEGAASPEAAFFNAKLQSLTGFGASPPNLTKILGRCGVDNLIARLHTKFLEFVGSEWKTSTIASLDARKAAADDDLQALGAVLDSLTTDRVLAHASTKVRHNSGS